MKSLGVLQRAQGNPLINQLLSIMALAYNIVQKLNKKRNGWHICLTQQHNQESEVNYDVHSVLSRI